MASNTANREKYDIWLSRKAELRNSGEASAARLDALAREISGQKTPEQVRKFRNAASVYDSRKKRGKVENQSPNKKRKTKRVIKSEEWIDAPTSTSSAPPSKDVYGSDDHRPEKDSDAVRSDDTVDRSPTSYYITCNSPARLSSNANSPGSTDLPTRTLRLDDSDDHDTDTTNTPSPMELLTKKRAILEALSDYASTNISTATTQLTKTRTELFALPSDSVDSVSMRAGELSALAAHIANLRKLEEAVKDASGYLEGWEKSEGREGLLKRIARGKEKLMRVFMFN